MAQNGTRASGPRCIALVGPFQSGKTTLLEAILTRTGTIARQGTVEAGNTVGDASREARDHRMSVEISVATAAFMGDSYTFIDCPGSVEFVHEMRAALPAVDAAVVVCELDDWLLDCSSVSYEVVKLSGIALRLSTSLSDLPAAAM